MQKNVAGQKWHVLAFQDEGGANPGEPVTGDAANITANLRIDGAAANAVDDTNPAELEDGYYVFDITQTESNGDQILIAPVSATANVNVIGMPAVYDTTPPNFPDAELATAAAVDRNADLIESQRGSHTWSGNTYYVDPANGNDSTGDGSRALPYATVQAAHDDLVTDSNHDVIVLVPGAAAGPTTMTDDVILSKRYLFIRGPGRDFIWTRAGAGDTISVTADGIELSGFQLNTAATGSGNGIQITDADFIAMHDLWINDTQGDGIGILRGDNCYIFDCAFTGTGQGGSGQGIDIIGTAGTSNYNVIHNNGFRDCAGDAIQISGGTTLNTHIFRNHIEGSSAWGIDIGASSTDAFVTGNVLGNNTSGAINDGGTTSVIQNNEQWSTVTTAQVNTEVDTALTDISLDHLVAVAVTGTDIADDSIMAQIASTGGDWDTFNNASDSLETNRDTLSASFGSIGATLGTAGDGLTDLGGMSTGMKAEVEQEALDALQNTALTEAYAADGAAFTMAQGMYMIWASLSEFAINTTTITAKKLDGSTTAMTFTLDDDTNPTSRTRAT